MDGLDHPPETPHTPSASDQRNLGLPDAQLLAWGVLALINAVVIGITVPLSASGGLLGRVLHHAYDLGHMLALGLASQLVVQAWQKWGPRRRSPWSVAAFAALAFIVALAVMRDDLEGFLQRQSGHGGRLPWLLAACVVLAALTTIVSRTGLWLDRPRWRWAAIVAAAGVGVGNHLFLRFNYPGGHFFAAWCAALLLGNAIASVGPMPDFGRFGRRPVPQLLRLVAGVACIASLVVVPRASVWRALFRTPGSVVAPLLARVQPQRDGGPPLIIEGSPWFSDRSHVAPIPPSSPPLVPKDPIVIFMTVDALRADVANDGRHADQLPAIEGLRRESVEFNLARAPSPSTVTTFMSMFTGKYYTGMYWTSIPSGPFKGAIMTLEDSSPRLAQLLDAGGVDTTHVVSLWGLAANVGAGNGFRNELETHVDYGPAAEVADLVINSLQTHSKGPQFIYTHFVDSHAPYNLAGTEGTEYERYLRDVALVDRQIGRIRQAVEKAGLLDRTVIILAADHGEAFGEHGTLYHAVTVYEELVRVPLFIRVPGVAHRRVDEPVTLMDLGPTILDLFGLPTPGTFLAQSLVPFLRGQNPHLQRPIAVDAGRRMQALYWDGRKTIVDLTRNTQEVYDLDSDPGETRNLVDVDSGRAGRDLRTLRAFFDAHKLRRPGYEAPWRQF